MSKLNKTSKKVNKPATVESIPKKTFVSNLTTEQRKENQEAIDEFFADHAGSSTKWLLSQVLSEITAKLLICKDDDGEPIDNEWLRMVVVYFGNIQTMVNRMTPDSFKEVNVEAYKPLRFLPTLEELKNHKSIFAPTKKVAKAKKAA